MIWSGEAEMLPWMCGRATLAIVVSSEFITVASIKAMVIGTRFLISASTAMGVSRAGRRRGGSRRP